ncbi:MAG: hypothetical protein JWQ74_3194 [Marmoricola sp.]|nr:hypothetical protein [Marmoricola sp.]
MSTEHLLSLGEHAALKENFGQTTYALIVSAVEDHDELSIDAIADREDGDEITAWLKDTTWYSDLDDDLPWVDDLDLYRTDRDLEAADGSASIPDRHA